MNFTTDSSDGPAAICRMSKSSSNKAVWVRRSLGGQSWSDDEWMDFLDRCQFRECRWTHRNSPPRLLFLITPQNAQSSEISREWGGESPPPATTSAETRRARVISCTAPRSIYPVKTPIRSRASIGPLLAVAANRMNSFGRGPRYQSQSYVRHCWIHPPESVRCKRYDPEGDQPSLTPRPR